MPQINGQIHFVFISQSKFSELQDKDENAIYFVVPDSEINDSNE